MTGTTTYAWDFENRLTSVTLPNNGGTVSFKYDPLGRRIYKSSSLGTSIFAYDGDNLIEEATSSGAAIARYAQGAGIDEPLAELRSGSTEYYEADGVGSVTSLSAPNGSLAQTYAFDTFGKQTGASGSLTNPFRYTGREFDAETNLYYYRARYYDPTAGRFITQDPLLFGGGDANFYAYVGGDPVYYADPSGKDRVCHVPSVCGYDLPHAAPRYTRSDALPPGSVQYTSPGGQMFWIPSSADWCEEYANAQANRYWNPLAILGAVGPGGAYDYQRDPTKHMFYSQFQQAANYSVGVYMQGWGFSRSQTTDIAQAFAKYNSSNYNPSQIEDWKQWWRAGWDDAKSGAYAKSKCGCKE